MAFLLMFMPMNTGDKMKVIFLDVDGVLCLDGSNMDPVAMTCLKDILTKTGAKIVMSSTWRLFDNLSKALVDALANVGIDEPIGKTPYLARMKRHVEIEKWLSENPEVHKYAVIDDFPDAEIKPESFFRTVTWSGLTEDIASNVIAYLRK
jgi:hypothetical protein